MIVILYSFPGGDHLKLHPEATCVLEVTVLLILLLKIKKKSTSDHEYCKFGVLDHKLFLLER